MKKISVLAMVLLLFLNLIGCASKSTGTGTDSNVLDFSELYKISTDGKSVSDSISELDGKNVRIKGFMAEQSPVDKSFIYLVNKPYTVCPFCVIYDNTKLEVISIYMGNGSGIEYTNQPVEVTGKLEVQPKTDVFNYTTQFRIYANKIKELDNSDIDQEIMAYFNQMNQKNIIAALQIAYVNINNALMPEVMNNSDLSDKERYEQLKERLNLDFISQGIKVMKGNLEYIRGIRPTDRKLKGIHAELERLFEDNITVLEGINSLNSMLKNFDDMETSQREEMLKKIKELTKSNKNGFDEFSKWNDSMRKN